MAWIILTEDFDCHLDFNTTVALTAKPEPQQVKRICADGAIAAGKATEVAAPNRDGLAPEPPAVEVEHPTPEPDAVEDAV